MTNHDVLALITGTDPDAAPRIDFPVDIGERWPVHRIGQREPISRTLRRMINERDDYHCTLCHKRFRMLELDHIVPWSAGGPDRSDNLRSACHQCNTDRSNYRTAQDTPATPVTLACDTCIRHWVIHYGLTRYGRVIPNAPAIPAWCWNCRRHSMVTDPGRLK